MSQVLGGVDGLVGGVLGGVGLGGGSDAGGNGFDSLSINGQPVGIGSGVFNVGNVRGDVSVSEEEDTSNNGGGALGILGRVGDVPRFAVDLFSAATAFRLLQGKNKRVVRKIEKELREDPEIEQIVEEVADDLVDEIRTKGGILVQGKNGPELVKISG